MFGNYTATLACAASQVPDTRTSLILTQCTHNARRPPGSVEKGRGTRLESGSRRGFDVSEAGRLLSKLNLRRSRDRRGVDGGETLARLEKLDGGSGSAETQRPGSVVSTVLTGGTECVGSVDSAVETLEWNESSPWNSLQDSECARKDDGCRELSSQSPKPPQWHSAFRWPCEVSRLLTRRNGGKSAGDPMAPSAQESARAMDGATPVKMLWQHSHPETTRTFQFKRHIEDKYHVECTDYEQLRQWCLQNVSHFWEEVWHFTQIRASQPYTKALDDGAPMFPRPAFFPDAKLNFAENLLFPGCNPPEDSYAVIEANEESRNHVTWKELRERVRQCSVAMTSVGVGEGDRVAGYVANHCNALVAMLAATSIGALWTAISPDTGVHAVLDRIQQIQPVLLFADNAVIYNGKVHGVHDKLKEITKELSDLKACVVFETVPDKSVDLSDVSFGHGTACSYHEFIDLVKDEQLEFAQLQPDHPVYILYSSGTTGKPKCIVHGAIGTLIQHKKEHDIQCDIRPGDRLFYFTTCTWMMWHWLVSGLATGATVVLYDGSPFRPLDQEGNGEMAMPRLIEELRITHFGTSAKYLSVLEQKSVKANSLANLKSLRAIYSTGSPLAPSTFEYVYRAFGPDLNLGSITGGTDIISLFGAPSQISPVYAGEIQVRGLGMAVEAWDFAGKNVSDSGEPGDLVCVKPFPCQPVMFYGKDGQDKYKKSYFETFPGVWHHGDFVRIDPKTGGLVMLGRSDGVLKPAGVRFGSSEIYNVLLEHFQEVEDAMCVGRRREHDTDEVVVLFVKMAQGAKFWQGLVDKIKAVIRKELSARHVPGLVDECPEIPVTINGKKVEVAVKQILCGTNVKTSASVANADCLEWYRHWNETHPE